MITLIVLSCFVFVLCQVGAYTHIPGIIGGGGGGEAVGMIALRKIKGE